VRNLLFLIFLLTLPSCLFWDIDLPCYLGNQIIRNIHPEFSMIACGGSGPDELYDSISVSFDIGKKINLSSDRKNILNVQKYLIQEINKNKKNKKYFTDFPVGRKNISLGFITPSYIKESWLVCIMSCGLNGVGYTTYWSSETDWDFYDYGEETYEEAERVAYGQGPFERIITHTKYGLNHVPIELHGPWGFFIQRAVIKQIQDGNFIYYALIDSKKYKLTVREDQVVIENTGKPLTEVFIPEPWTP
jgi:hypothetical protein